MACNFPRYLAYGAPESRGYLLHINSFDGFIFLILVVAGSLPMRVDQFCVDRPANEFL